MSLHETGRSSQISKTTGEQKAPPRLEQRHILKRVLQLGALSGTLLLSASNQDVHQALPKSTAYLESNSTITLSHTDLSDFEQPADLPPIAFVSPDDTAIKNMFDYASPYHYRRLSALEVQDSVTPVYERKIDLADSIDYTSIPFSSTTSNDLDQSAVVFRAPNTSNPQPDTMSSDIRSIVAREQALVNQSSRTITDSQNRNYLYDHFWRQVDEFGNPNRRNAREYCENQILPAKPTDINAVELASGNTVKDCVEDLL